MFILHTGGIIGNAAQFSNLMFSHAFDMVCRYHKFSCKAFCLPFRITESNDFGIAKIACQFKSAKTKSKIMTNFVCNGHSVSIFATACSLINTFFNADMSGAYIGVCMNLFRQSTIFNNLITEIVKKLGHDIE